MVTFDFFEHDIWAIRHNTMLEKKWGDSQRIDTMGKHLYEHSETAQSNSSFGLSVRTITLLELSTIKYLV